MISCRVRNPQAAFLRAGRVKAFPSPVRLRGRVALHDEGGVFAVVDVDGCRRIDDAGARDAGLTRVELSSRYSDAKFIATIKDYTAVNGGPAVGDAPFVYVNRHGDAYRDDTPIARRLAGLCAALRTSGDRSVRAVAAGLAKTLAAIGTETVQDAPLDFLHMAAAHFGPGNHIHETVAELRDRYLEDRLRMRALPILKHPDPRALLEASAKRTVGYLSRLRRDGRLGIEQLLVNELKLPGYDKYSAWARVKQGPARHLDELNDDVGAAVAPYQVEQYKDTKGGFWFIPLEVLAKYDPPVPVPARYARGRTFGPEVDLDDLVNKQEAGVDYAAVDQYSDKELKTMLGALAEAFPGSEGAAREAVLNDVLFLTTELSRRGVKYELPKEVEEAVAAMRGGLEKKVPGDPDASTTAEVHPSGDGDRDPVALEAVLSHVKPIVVRDGAVALVGGLCNQGVTRNDIDVLLRGPLDEATRKVIQFRIGRMFPPGLSERVTFLNDDGLGGPFTNHVVLYDLALVPRSPFALKEMVALKADDFNEHYDNAKHPAVLQAHFRGQTMHFDLRMKVDGYLIGWTVASQKKGLPDVADMAAAKRIAGEVNVMDGGRFNKPMRAPGRLWATKKSKQPTEWLDVEGEFEEGEVGATANKPGYIVRIDRPKVQFGTQKPYFHEYFLTGGEQLNGVLVVRMLEGGAGGQTAEGETFWALMVAKDSLPYAISRRAVNTGWMPPDGIAAIPDALMKKTPAEFQYWEKKGAEAKRTRDALVDARVFTGSNVQVKDGDFVVVEKRADAVQVTFPFEKGDEPKGKTFLEHAEKWVLERGLLDPDSDYEGELGRAVIRMAGLFSSEWHSGMSALMARAYFNWLCDEWDGLHTMMLNDEEYKKVMAALAKRAVSRIQKLIDDAVGGLPIFLHLPEPHGEMVWKGLKTVLVCEPWLDLAGKTVSVESGGKVWCRVTCAAPRDVAADDLASTRSQHRVTEAERRRWWPTAKRLRAWDIVIEGRYETPLTVSPGAPGHAIVGAAESIGDVEMEPEALAKAARAKYRVLYQYFKTVESVRAGPSRKRWFVVLWGGGTERLLRCDSSPLENDSVACTMLPFAKAMTTDEVEGEIPPGESYDGLVLNDQKRGRSWVVEEDSGEALVHTDEDDFARVSLRGGDMKGTFVLEKEGDAGIWTFSRERQRNKRFTVEDGVQYWRPEDKEDGDDRGGDRKRLDPPAFFRPMKPAARTRYDTAEALRDGFLTPAALKGGVYVEPKWNGFVVVIENTPDKVVMFTEDTMTDYAGVWKPLADEVKKSFGDSPVILVGEFMAVRRGGDEEEDMVPRRELAAFRGKEWPEGMEPRVRVFDCIYDGKNLTAEWQSERRRALERRMQGVKTKMLQLSPAWLVKTADAFDDATDRALKLPGSEGIMAKLASATYSLGGENDAWAKAKLTRQVVAVVYDRHPVKGSPGVYNFMGAVGPVDNPDEWDNVVEVGGKKYAAVGKTFNSKTDAKEGDRIIVDATELYVYKLKDGKRRLNWFTPSVVEKTDALPTTISGFLAMDPQVIEEGESVKRWIIKSAEERFVLGTVLEPIEPGDEPDAQKDRYTAAEVRKACHYWMERYGKLGLMHERILQTGKARVLENYIAPLDMTINGDTVKAGTWLLGTRIIDDALWQAVKDGRITGYSIGGYAHRRRV